MERYINLFVSDDTLVCDWVRYSYQYVYNTEEIFICEFLVILKRKLEFLKKCLSVLRGSWTNVLWNLSSKLIVCKRLKYRKGYRE